MKILVIAPHLDDEVLGCGASIVSHVSEGHTVSVCFVANRVYEHKYDEEKMSVELTHAREAQKILGYQNFHFLNLPDERLDSCLQDIIIPMEEYVFTIRPEVVYSPFRSDNNQDHRAVAKALQVVLRPAAAGFVHRWLMYETPSCTDQTPSPGIFGFQPNVYRDISDYLNIKLKALACYETEVRHHPHPRSSESIRALAIKRGMEAGLSYAEAFMLVREKE
jgi:LmbE family N-acetylglucosaminyl deacetylase